MPSAVHVVVTANAAGVEHYVCTTAAGLVERGWEVSVVGGSPRLMPKALGDRVRWFPGATTSEALGSLARLGRQEICHVHMTAAEGVSIAGRLFHRAPIVSTRHFAAHRGRRAVARALAPVIAASLSREIAISEFVASRMERWPDAVLPNAVPLSPWLWRPANRVVLVLQRLESEKDTLTALRAWRASRLAEDGWSMRIVGAGSQRAALERWAAAERMQNVHFAGWVEDVHSELAAAGMLLATAPAEPFGLGVLEAMAAGVPVVACAAGGHLETVGRLSEASMFPPRDVDAAGDALRSYLRDASRQAVSVAGRQLVEAEFTVARHIDRLLEEYDAARSPLRRRRRLGANESSAARELRELVVCSLEPWDEVWRRNQFFTHIMLRRNPELRVLFVEPAADPLHDLWNGRFPGLPRFQRIDAGGRLYAFRPAKVLPRKLGPAADRLLRAQVITAARLMGFVRPALWVNDVTYAPVIPATKWPSVYDITDDWLLAPFARRELNRLQELDRLALSRADSVVVCSPALAESRRSRSVVLIRNGVDVAHFRKRQRRPEDLCASPAAVYLGSLHESRLDVALVVELAVGLPGLSVVLVGPNHLTAASSRRLGAAPNVTLLGPRPYSRVPAYLQHADVIVIPHVITPFTESLDPIKAYECIAVETPCVATPVAGFRELRDEIIVAERENFVDAVCSALLQPPSAHAVSPRGWDDAAREFEEVVVAVMSA